MYFIDSYGNTVEIPGNTGRSTNRQGAILALVEPTPEDRRLSRVMSDSVEVFRGPTYKCTDYCSQLGFDPVVVL